MLSRYIHRDNIIINPKIESKEELFKILCEKAEKDGYIASANAFYEILLQKENQNLTELKPNVVLPHARGEMVNELFVYFITSKKGVSYQGAKKNIAELIIFIGIPSESRDYLKLLASVSRLLSKEDILSGIVKAEVVDDVLYNLKKLYIEVEKVENPKKFLLILTINKNIDKVDISSHLAEIGMDLPTEIDGRNLGHASFFIPFLSAFGFMGEVNKYNKTYIGLTDERDAASRLFSILKKEGIDLNQNGIGSLYQIEVMHSFGGYADLEF